MAKNRKDLIGFYPDRLRTVTAATSNQFCLNVAAQVGGENLPLDAYDGGGSEVVKGKAGVFSKQWFPLKVRMHRQTLLQYYYYYY